MLAHLIRNRNYDVVVGDPAPIWPPLRALFPRPTYAVAI
jgi:hypothetical protein